MESSEQSQLLKLSELKDYQVEDGESDIRGWYVVGSDGERLGQIYDLIVDASLEKVRYLDIVLEKELHTEREDRHILMPVGQATVEEDEDIIVVEGLTQNRIRFYPVYSGEELTPEYESSLRAVLDEYSQRSGRESSESSSMQAATRRDHPDARLGEEQYEEAMQSDDPLVKMRAERDKALAERDILRSELAVLKDRLRSARRVLDTDSSEHEGLDDH